MSCMTWSDSIDKLVKDRDMQLHVFKERYGDGVICFLSMNEDHVEHITYCFTAGDSFYEEVSIYFNDAEWFPIVYGNSVMDSLSKMGEFLSSKDTGNKVWLDAVERACGEFLHDNHIKRLPANINDYMKDWYA